MSEMRVVGVRVELPANQPILLLRASDGDRYLHISIGSVARPRRRTQDGQEEGHA